MLISQFFAFQNAKAAPPFCLNVPGVKPNCIFYSANACREKLSSTVGANCALNREELDIPEGPGLWCLVTSVRFVQCYYDNFASCESQALSKDGICVRSLKRPPVSTEFESDIEQLL